MLHQENVNDDDVDATAAVMDGIDDVTEKATATTGDDDDDDAHDASASRTSIGDVDGGDDAEPAPMTL